MKFIIFTIAFFCLGMLTAQPSAAVFPLDKVEITQGDFKQAATTDFEYMLKLDTDRLLAPFLREAGLKPKAESYTNWENSGLDGHTAGHYLSALAMYYASTGDKKAKERIDYSLAELRRAQLANGNGYVGGIPGSKELWQQIHDGKINASSFSLNDRWVPLYNIHKTFAGLKDLWIHTRIPLAKTMLIELTDWFIGVTENLSKEQVQDMLRSEHGGLNEVFAEVYDITQEPKYLTLAEKFSQVAFLEPLAAGEDILTGKHANTQIPKFIGFDRISQLENKEEYHEAALHFWENVTSKRSLSIGGNSVREHFNPVDDFSEVLSSVQGPETCNTYNMLKLSKLLFEDSGEERFIDFYERGLYNHILSSQDPEGGGFVYFTPMRPGHYRVYSQPQTSFWCCVGSGMENHTKYNELIYAKKGDSLYVNLFIPSTLEWDEKSATLVQETGFPNINETQLVWKGDNAKNTTILIRYPSWVKNGEMQVTINGKEQPINTAPGSFVPLRRNWKSGDAIKVKLPMHLALEEIPDHSGYVSFKYGPIILAAITETQDQEGMLADDSRGGHIAEGPLMPVTQMPTIVIGNKDDILKQLQPVSDKALTFGTKDLFLPQKYSDLQLQPFYKIQEARYAIYFKTETPEGYREIQDEWQAQEAREAYLASITIDDVAPGEQQPESDHFIQMENSNSGLNQDRHWRDASGWFSYELTDNNSEARKLRITYFGSDSDRKFKVLVNGTTLAEEDFNGERGNDFFTKDYELPEQVLQEKNPKLILRFEAAKGSRTAGVYGVRLLKSENNKTD